MTYLKSALLILFLSLSAAQSWDIPRKESGITATFTQVFFDQYRKQLISLFEQKLQEIRIEDSAPTFSFGFGKVILSLFNKRLIEFELDNQSSQLTLQEEKPNVKLLIKNIKLQFMLDFDLHSVPEWVKDKGTGSVNITGGDITIFLVPYQDEGKLQFSLDDV